jgi:methylamine dehydrogenase accessory protein MauD
MSLELVLLLARLALAAVFAAAAVAKLADVRGTRSMLTGFGVPRRSVGTAAIVLPVAELAVAATLLSASLAWEGALAAAALLTGFTVAIAAQLARGRRPDCNCFGSLQAKPIGPLTLLRNGVLLGTAALVAAVGSRDAGPSSIGWLAEPLLATIGALVLLVVVQATLFVVLLRRHGRLLVRLDAIEDEVPTPGGLPVGAEAPEFLLPDLDGELASLASLRTDGLPVLLLFSNPACGPCASLLPAVGRWQHELRNELVVALVSTGAIDDNRAHAEEHELTRMLLAPDHEVAFDYEAGGTPMAVLVDPDGTVASPLAQGADAIVALVAGATETRKEVPVRA